jgi:hypothetical protein
MGGFCLKLASITDPFVLLYRNRSYTSERSKLNDHSKNPLQQAPIWLYSKISSLFCNTDTLKQSEVNVFKLTCEYLLYNNLTNTRLARDVLCNTISIWQQRILWGMHYLRVSSSLRLSKCIRMHHINPILLSVVA